MFGRPSRSAIPESDEVDWIFEVFAWLLGQNGGFEAFEGTELVLPTPEFFQSTAASRDMSSPSRSSRRPERTPA
jgi:hypothetical protein